MATKWRPAVLLMATKMKVRYSHIKSKNEIVLIVQHRKIKKQKKIIECLPQNWDEKLRSVNESHPLFEEVYPDMMKIMLKARKLIREGMTDPAALIQAVTHHTADNPELLDFWREYLQKLQSQIDAANARRDVLERNRLEGNYSYYTSVLATVSKHTTALYYNQMKPMHLQELESQLLHAGKVARSTVVKYMKAVRVMYRKMVQGNNLPHLDPFTYNGVKEQKKSYEQKKRRLNDMNLRKLAQLELTGTFATARDMFMVLFDCGGCDLQDVYFLQNDEIVGDRILSQRSKVRGSYIDVQISARTDIFMQKHPGIDGFVFPFRKDLKGYRTWAGNMRRQLKLVGLRHGIATVNGGELGWKVARHTFASRAKDLGIDGDLLRELMGHRRNDVDNYYKEAYPEAVRNAAQLKILDI